MHNRKAFTLLELFVTLAILMVLISIAFVPLRRMAEKQWVKEAEMSLMAIYNAENRYSIQNKQYFVCPSCTLGQIAENLTLVFSVSKFTLSIENNPDLPAGEGFVARARRIDGPCAGTSITINETSTVLTKECALWQ